MTRILAEPDQEHMRRAFELAKKGRFGAHPNPMVGAVVVNGGEVVGEGWHESPGQAHAEAVALSDAGRRAEGGTLYVSLEPCSHIGRTPPCTEAIIASGVTRVVYAIEDPDSDVPGNGGEILRSAGISVSAGIMRDEALRLNGAYVIHRRLGRPRVTYKAALTLDGKTAARDGSSQWISGPAAREQVQELRAEADAIAVGIGTVLADDPSLTCRLSGFAGTPPVRIVFDSDGRLPTSARVLSDDAPTWVVTTRDGAMTLRNVHGEDLVVVEAKPAEGGLDLADALSEMGRLGIVELLVEGGARLAGGFLSRRLIDRLVVFIAPKILGGSAGVPLFGGVTAGSIDEAFKFNFTTSALVGDDLRLEAVITQLESVISNSLSDEAEGQ